ncbi:MAG: serine/threonine protein kinase, partial [Actinomycetes bacterium]
MRPGDPPYLGGYRIERRLGEGGQGLVYLGVSPSGEKVAIKVLRSRPLAGDASAISREIAAARQVAEFCTASILDVALD